MAYAARVPAETSCSSTQPLRTAKGSRYTLLHRTPPSPFGIDLTASGARLPEPRLLTSHHPQMMMKKYLGIGTEVGCSKRADLAKTNPALAAMNLKFGMIHGLSSLASAVSFGSLAIHSWYLASKLDL